MPRSRAVLRGIAQRRYNPTSEPPRLSSPLVALLSPPLVHVLHRTIYPRFPLCTNGVYRVVLWPLLDHGRL